MAIDEQLQKETLSKCQEYYDAFAQEFGKRGFIWLRNDETGQFMVYTEGDYAQQIMDFLVGLDPRAGSALGSAQEDD